MIAELIDRLIEAADRIESLERQLERINEERAAMGELIAEYQRSERKLESKVAELELQLAELEEDAERYRWLRDKANYAKRTAPLCWHTDTQGNTYDAAVAGDLDDAIDAAIAAMSVDEQKDAK